MVPRPCQPATFTDVEILKHVLTLYEEVSCSEVALLTFSVRSRLKTATRLMHVRFTASFKTATGVPPHNP